jgi:hypothetical protein
MAKTKYGIKVPLAVDDYIWVTEIAEPGDFDLKPVLYDTFAEAQRAAEIWGPMAEVVVYDKNNIIS